MSIIKKQEALSKAAKISLQKAYQKCLLCGCKEFNIRYDFGKHRILYCTDCKFMWLYPQPTKLDLQSVYNENYFHNHNFFLDNNKSIYGYYDYISERFNKQSQFQDVLDEITDMLDDFKPGKLRYLDIGCGLGYMLDIAHDRGFEVEGVEFNSYAVEKIRSKYTFPVFNGDIIDFPGRNFDVVSMFDVIEHLTDPLRAVSKVRGILNPQSLFILTTTDCDSIVSRLLGKNLEDFRRIREHLFFFNRDNIRILLERAGFEVIETRFYGHTFRLDFLASRIKMMSPCIGDVLLKVLRYLHISNSNLYINPFTKMIVFSRPNN